MQKLNLESSKLERQKLKKSKFKSLTESYAQLSDAEQQVLQVLAVVYEPVNQTVLKKILLEAGRLDEQLRGLDSIVTQALKDKLEARDLITIKSGKLKCAQAIQQWLVLETINAGTYTTIKDEGLLEIPLRDVQAPGFYSYADNNSPYQARRRLLYAVHGDDPERVFELLEITDPYEQPRPDLTRNLLDICASPILGHWLPTTPIALQYQIMQPILDTSASYWSEARQLQHTLRNIVTTNPDAHTALRELDAEQRLYRGDWQTLAEDLLRLRTPKATALLASLTFLQGDTAAAVSLFQVSLVQNRKLTRKRTVAIPGIPGVLYLLALLKDKGADNASLANQQSTAINKQKHDDPHYNSLWVIEWIRDIIEGKRAFEPDVLSMNLSFASPLTNLATGLAMLWNNHKPDDAFLAHINKGLDAAATSGYDWFAFESRQLIARLTGGARQTTAPFGPPLTQVVVQLEGWERSLNALAGLAVAGKSGTSPKAEGSQRIAWFINDELGYYSLKPREQKRKKTGGWSVGRAIALKRLVDEPEAFNYLTEADRKICRFIRRENNQNYYGYANNTYSLDTVDALLAASGHPLLYRENDPEQAVTISEGKPELQIIERGEQFHLSMAPYPDDEKQLVVTEHGRISIYRFSPEILQIARILTYQGLSVPLSGKDKVLESVTAIAPLLTVHSDISGVIATQATLVESDPRLHIYLQPQDAGLRLAFHVQPFAGGPLLRPGQGGASIFAEIQGKQLHTQRDLTAEKQQMNAVLAACQSLCEYSPNEWQWEATEDALEGLLTLQTFGDQVVLNWPEGKHIKLSKPVGVSQMSVSLQAKTDWFQLTGELQVNANQVYSMQALLELADASASRFVELGDGEFLTLTSELRQRLDAMRSYNNKGKVHALNAQNLQDSLIGMDVTADESWNTLQARLRAARELDPKVPSTLQADLRDYQTQGYQWLARLYAWGAGACLADDMGLGKTLQTLALLVDKAAQGPSLVLAPTSVCSNWLAEAARFAPTLNPIRFGVDDRTKTLEDLQPYDVLICSYGLLQTEFAAMHAISWNIIIADEAQAFKNTATKRSKAVMGLTGHFKMIATGTPIENHLGELWNLFQFINPGLLGSLQDFNQKYAQTIQTNGDAKASTALRHLISPFILRRLKRDVLAELPPRTEITIGVDLSEAETALYEALRLQAVEQLDNKDIQPNQQRIRALASITKLRRAVCNPNLVMPTANLASSKLEAFGLILDELLDNKHKALVFSQFVGHLALIREYLDDRGINYQYLDGSTPAKKRTTAINAFQGGDGDLFLISLKAGGVGLNLTAADYVIHMDPWWNPAVEDQASDRAHRIGQRRPVTVYRLVANNTIEEKIVNLHAKKRDLADSLLEGSEMSAKMSLDDMLALISPAI
ncbi:MAG: hypothetical protein ACJAWK_000378 [Candidatus Azotimanducaceae bacterium]